MKTPPTTEDLLREKRRISIANWIIITALGVATIFFGVGSFVDPFNINDHHADDIIVQVPDTCDIQTFTIQPKPAE